MSMVERIIFNVIKDGLAYYKGDDGQRFERFLLNELRLTADEAARARIYFAGGITEDGDTFEARPPTLQHGYARTGGPFPCWALILGSERESGTYLEDNAEFLDSAGMLTRDPETGEVLDTKIRRVTYTYQIHVIADHPDITLYYYHLLKRIILAQHNEFTKNDLDPPLVSGADLAPDPRYLPNDIFIRQVILEIDGDECWTEHLDGYANKISGIAIDDTGEGRTAGEGSVVAHVTPYAGS